MRLALAKMLLEPYSMLILDEPTNHLDIQSKELLKQAIQQYEGTVIVVSHDRSFLSGLAKRIYEFKNRQVKEHIGTIYELLNKKKLDELNTSLRQEAPKEQATNQSSWNKVKYEERKSLDKDIRKKNNQLKKLEREVMDLEEKQKHMKEKLASNSGLDADDSIYADYQALENDLAAKMEEWESLTETLEQLEAQREKLL